MTTRSWQADWGRGPFTVSGQRDALRAEIIASPRDAALPAAYAQMAIDEGDPRGEYIRLSILREDAAPREHRSIDDALEDLRGRYGPRIYAEWYGTPFGGWLGQMVRNAAAYERFGFVAHVRARADDIPALRALTPLRMVEVLSDLSWGRPVLSANAFDQGVPPMRSPDARTLSFGNEDLSEDELGRLSALTHLESLSFVYRRPASFERALARADAFPSLRAVTLLDCSVDAALLAEAVQARGLRELTVEISRTEELERLVSGLAGCSLEVLSISGIAPDLYQSIDLSPFRAAHLPKLHTLVLSEYTLEGVDGLAASPVLSHLHTLGLDAIDNGGEVFAALAPALGSAAVRELTLNHTHVDGAVLASAADVGALAALESVTLGFVGNGEASFQKLLRAMPRLARLDTGYVELQPEMLRAVAALPSLRAFHARSYRMKPDEAVAVLTGGSSPQRLRSLDLPDLSGASAEALTALVETPALDRIASLGLHCATKRLSPEQLTLLRRRFGHRLIPSLFDTRLYASSERYETLPEPDLDPWC